MRTKLTFTLEGRNFTEAAQLAQQVNVLVCSVEEGEKARATKMTGPYGFIVSLEIETHAGRVSELMTELEEKGLLE